MTDLRYASHAEIVQELQKRYPVYLLAIVHPVEGKPGVLTPRADFGAASRSEHEVMGLANFVALMVAANAGRSASLMQQTGPPPPLDPPTQRPA